MPNIKSLAWWPLRYGQKKFLTCRWHHLRRWCHLGSRLEYFILLALRSTCAKYQVSSFNGLWDVVQRNFWQVGGTTPGGATWCPDWNILEVSEIWTTQYFGSHFETEVAPPGAQNLFRLSPPRGAQMCQAVAYFVRIRKKKIFNKLLYCMLHVKFSKLYKLLYRNLIIREV